MQTSIVNYIAFTHIYGDVEVQDEEEVKRNQKSEANSQFFKYVKNNYESWLKESEDKPVLSHTLFKQKVLPHLKDYKPSFFILIDNSGYI